MIQKKYPEIPKEASLSYHLGANTTLVYWAEEESQRENCAGQRDGSLKHRETVSSASSMPTMAPILFALWEQSKVLHECVMLTWEHPHQGPKSLVPVGVRKLYLGKSQGWQIFLIEDVDSVYRKCSP